MNVNIYIATTWKSPKQKSGAAMYLIEAVGKDGKTAKRQGAEKFENATETEAALTMLNTALKRFTKSAEIRVFTLSDGILRPIKNGWIQTWKENNFTTAKGKQIKHAELWKETIELLEQHEYEFFKELAEYKLWMPRELEKYEKEGR